MPKSTRKLVIRMSGQWRRKNHCALQVARAYATVWLRTCAWGACAPSCAMRTPVRINGTRVHVRDGAGVRVRVSFTVLSA
eukprot:8060629-Alexandrium_andersonii.AAC.1